MSINPHQWNQEPYRWQEYVLPSSRWKIDLAITLLFVTILLAIHVGDPWREGATDPPAVSVADHATSSGPHSVLRIAHERCWARG
jgi:hypothetical protein